MPNSEFSDNQTVFAQEEPLLEHSRKKRTLTAKEVKKPSRILLLGGLAAIIFLVFGGTIAMVSTQRKEPVVTVTPSPTPKKQTASDLEQLFQELRLSLEKADPSTNSMSFPPVAQEITVSAD